MLIKVLWIGKMFHEETDETGSGASDDDVEGVVLAVVREFTRYY